jgi:hypothetical protein
VNKNLALVVVAVGVVVAIAIFVVIPRREPNDFNQCIERAVETNHSSDKGVNLEISNKIVALFTGGTTGAGDEPALKIGVESKDQVAFRALSEGATRQLIDTCGQHYNRILGPINAELQVWTKVDGQNVSDVTVTRVARAGDFCRTVAGNCPLLIHNVHTGAAESFQANYNGLVTLQDFRAQDIEQGLITINLEPASYRAILVQKGQSPVSNAIVIVESDGAGTSIRNVECIAKERFGRSPDFDCAQADTGENGHGASFLMPATLTKLNVRVRSETREREYEALAHGMDFVVSIDGPVGVQHDTGSEHLGSCNQGTTEAVRAVLQQAAGRAEMQTAQVNVVFRVTGTQVNVLGVTPDSDLARLAAATLAGHKTIDGSAKSACKGQLTWTAH